MFISGCNLLDGGTRALLLNETDFVHEMCSDFLKEKKNSFHGQRAFAKLYPMLLNCNNVVRAGHVYRI